MKNMLCMTWIAGLVVGGVLVSPSARAAAEPEVLRPFNGKNLEGWKTRRGDGQNLWRVGTATLDARDRKLLAFAPGGQQLINLAPGHGARLDLYSEAVHHGARERGEGPVRGHGLGEDAPERPGEGHAHRRERRGRLDHEAQRLVRGDQSRPRCG